MSKNYEHPDQERQEANREKINAREAEIRRPAKKIDIINPTIQDDKERAVFLSQELKNMLSNTEYVEDLLKNLDPEDRSKIKEIFSKCYTIKKNLQALEYSFPLYKKDSSGLNELSSALNKIDVFNKNSYIQDAELYGVNDPNYDPKYDGSESSDLYIQEPTIDDLHLKAYNDNLKSNFEENKENLYAALGGLIDQYSE